MKTTYKVLLAVAAIVILTVFILFTRMINNLSEAENCKIEMDKDWDGNY